jgi:hypothetical protein
MMQWRVATMSIPSAIVGNVTTNVPNAGMMSKTVMISIATSDARDVLSPVIHAVERDASTLMISVAVNVALLPVTTAEKP